MNDITALSPEKLAEIRQRYSPKPIPKCRICGAEMSIGAVSASRTVYACSGATHDENGWHYAPGRSLADDHYSESRVTVVDVSDPDVLALVEALEARDKQVAFLKEQLAQLANFNPDWDRLEAATDSLREHMAELNSAQERIAELESRTVTVKLPDPLMPAQHNSGELFMTPDNVIHGGYLNRDDVLRILAAAGIQVIEGEQKNG